MSETPYRANEPPPEDPPDQEHLAISIIAKRTRRIRGLAVVIAFFIGLALSACFYNFFWDYYEAHHMPIPLKMVAVASMTLGFLPSLLLTTRISNVIVKIRREAWMNVLAQEKGLDREQLEEMTRSFLG